MKAIHIFTTFVCVTMIPPVSLATEHLGPAEGFTVFAFQSFQANNTNCSGRVAVGGPATYNTVGIGSALTNSNGERDDLIVKGHLTWINGENFNGNIQVDGSINLSNVDVPNGTVGEEVTIDFCEAENDLNDISESIALIPSNGEVLRAEAVLLMSGTHDTLNVFELVDSDLHQIEVFSINVPEGSSVIVNMNLNTVYLKNFDIVYTGCDASHVLFNIPDTNQIQLKNIEWLGTILAPKATVHFNNARIDGALICQNIQGNGESHHAPFVGYCACCCHDDDDHAGDDDDDHDGDGDHDDGDDDHAGDDDDDHNGDGDHDDDDHAGDDDDDHDGDGDHDDDDHAGDDDDDHDGDGDHNDDDDDDHDGDDHDDDDNDCQCTCDCNHPTADVLYD